MGVPWLEDRGAVANAVGVGVNLALTIAKLSVALVAGSEALLADGLNSAGDVIATVIGLVGYRYAQAPADDNHPYGHGNAESVAGLIIGGILLATGGMICLEGTRALLRPDPVVPGAMALWVALATVVTKEALYRYAHRVGTELNAPSLLAAARDHRADVLAAGTVFGAVLGARMGVPWLDPVGAMGIGVYIAWMAWEPIRTNMGVLMDEAPPEVAEDIRRVARTVPEVREAGQIRVHPLGSYLSVDLEIYLDGTLSLHQAHDIAHQVEDAILGKVPHVRDVTVHVNPTGLPDQR